MGAIGQVPDEERDSGYVDLQHTPQLNPFRLLMISL